MKLEIHYVTEDQIIPATYNPRNINEKEFNGLKSSLEKFGLVDPLIVNKRNNILVGGHQRFKAAKDLGYKEFPVVYVDLDEVKEKALNIALNSQEISGAYDRDTLSQLVQEIEESLGGYFLADLNIDDTLAKLGDCIMSEEEQKEAKEHEDKQKDKESKFILEIICDTELDLHDLREELEIRGIKCEQQGKKKRGRKPKKQ